MKFKFPILIILFSLASCATSKAANDTVSDKKKMQEIVLSKALVDAKEFCLQFKECFVHLMPHSQWILVRATSSSNIGEGQELYLFYSQDGKLDHTTSGM